MLAEFIERVRQNHALEHATVSLLIARLGPDLRLVGRATDDGFYIYGGLPAAAVAESAREGLNRLQRGEAAWAVTPLCGTNLVTAGVLASLSTLLVLGSAARKDRVGNALVAGIAAVTAAQPLGRLIQKHITTSSALANVEIVSIDSRADGRYHKVKTRRTTS